MSGEDGDLGSPLVESLERNKLRAPTLLCGGPRGRAGRRDRKPPGLHRVALHAPAGPPGRPARAPASATAGIGPAGSVVSGDQAARYSRATQGSAGRLCESITKRSMSDCAADVLSSMGIDQRPDQVGVYAPRDRSSGRGRTPPVPRPTLRRRAGRWPAAPGAWRSRAASPGRGPADRPRRDNSPAGPPAPSAIRGPAPLRPVAQNGRDRRVSDARVPLLGRQCPGVRLQP